MDDEDQINPAEAARDRRRDRDADARARAGMQTGLAKQFKQVLDTQKRRADEAERDLAALRADDEARRKRAKDKPSPRNRPRPELPPD
jgi:hypothetical protein